MKSLTTAQRNILVGENGGDDRLCSRFQNADSYFLKFISYSRTGIYAPTYRIGTISPYDNKSCSVFPNEKYYETCIGFLNSKLGRMIFKTILGHTVDAQVDDVKELPFSNHLNTKELIEKIISKQKTNPRYDYASNEQIEIDKLVYEAYSLNAADVLEVENWYARRYPKLSKAQKANLVKVGKSDDYLELYGLA